MTLDARNEKLLKDSYYRVKVFQDSWEKIESMDPAAVIDNPLVPVTITMSTESDNEHETSQTSPSYIPGRMGTGLPIDGQEQLSVTYPISRLHVQAVRTPEGGPLLQDIQRWGTTIGNEFILLFQRNMRDTLRNLALLRIQIVQIIVLILLLGLVFLQLGHSQTDIQNRIGVLFFFVINITFTIISPILNIFPLEKKIISRERAAGSYRSFSVFVAKALSLLPTLFIINTIYATALYWMVGLKSNAGAFFSFLVYIWALILVALSLGLVIGSFSKNQQMAQILGPTVVIIFVIFGGNFVNPSSIPGYLVWIFWISPIQYIYKALMQNEFYGSTFTCDSAAMGCITNGEQIIERYDLANPSKWVCFLVVLGMTLFYLLLGFVGVKVNTAPKRQKILADKMTTVNN